MEKSGRRPGGADGVEMSALFAFDLPSGSFATAMLSEFCVNSSFL